MPTGMSAADLDRALAWLVQAPPPRLLAAPRAGAGAAARPGSAAWLGRRAQSCGALPGRCAPLARRQAAPPLFPSAAVWVGYGSAARLWALASHMPRATHHPFLKGHGRPLLVVCPKPAAGARDDGGAGARARREAASGDAAAWALAQAAAGALVEQRLRCLGGGPTQTLAALEAALQVRTGSRLLPYPGCARGGGLPSLARPVQAATRLAPRRAPPRGCGLAPQAYLRVVCSSGVHSALGRAASAGCARRAAPRAGAVRGPGRARRARARRAAGPAARLAAGGAGGRAGEAAGGGVPGLRRRAAAQRRRCSLLRRAQESPGAHGRPQVAPASTAGATPGPHEPAGRPSDYSSGAGRASHGSSLGGERRPIAHAAQACEEWAARARPLLMRGAAAVGHHVAAAAAAMGQLADARSRLAALLAEQRPATPTPPAGPPPAASPGPEPARGAPQPRILARRAGPAPDAPDTDAAASSAPDVRSQGSGANPDPASEAASAPERLADDVREALRAAAAALAALGEPDEIEGLRAHAARVFAPLAGLLTGRALGSAALQRVMQRLAGLRCACRAPSSSCRSRVVGAFV